MGNNIHSITHPSGVTYSVQIIEYSEHQSILDELKGKELPEYENKSNSDKVFLLNDGRLLSVSFPTATIFSSLEGFKLQWEDAKQYRKRILATLPLQKILLTKDFREIKYSKVDLPLFEKFLKEQDESILFNRTKEAWILNDGKALIKYRSGLALLFDNRQELEIYFDYFDNDSVRRPILCGRNPYAENFVEKVPFLLEELAEILKIPPQELNSGKPIGIVKYIYREIVTDSYANKLFLPLLAYLGNLHIQSKGGEWQLEYDDVFNTWTPDVQTLNGRRLNLPRQVQKILDSENFD